MTVGEVGVDIGVGVGVAVGVGIGIRIGAGAWVCGPPVHLGGDRFLHCILRCAFCRIEIRYRSHLRVNDG